MSKLLTPQVVINKSACLSQVSEVPTTVVPATVQTAYTNIDKDGQSLYQCTYCKEIHLENSVEGAEYHRLKKHYEGPGSKCKLCQKDVKAILGHLRNNHTKEYKDCANSAELYTNDESLKCPICRQFIDHFDGLLAHIEKEHLPTIICDLCHQTVLPNQLPKHRQVMHSQEIRHATRVEKKSIQPHWCKETYPEYELITDPCGHNYFLCVACGDKTPNIFLAEIHHIMTHQKNSLCTICQMPTNYVYGHFYKRHKDIYEEAVKNDNVASLTITLIPSYSCRFCNCKEVVFKTIIEHLHAHAKHLPTVTCEIPTCVFYSSDEQLDDSQEAKEAFTVPADLQQAFPEESAHLLANIKRPDRRLLRRMRYFKNFLDIVAARGGTCLSSLKDYQNANYSKLQIKCEQGHIFEKTLEVLKSYWCPDCNIPIGETLCREILFHIFNKNFKKLRPDWLKNEEGNNLELDLYNEELKLAVEYNGVQHYRYIEYFFDSQEKFIKLQRDDKCKARKCAELGIHLIIVPYTVKYKEIYEYLLNACQQAGYQCSPPTPFQYDIGIAQGGILKRLKEAVAKHDGELLDMEEDTVVVECSRGHCWRTSFHQIIYGHWCAECNHLQTKARFEKLAAEKQALQASAVKENSSRNHQLRSKTVAAQKQETQTMVAAQGSKSCTKCGQIKSLDNFHIKRDTQDGYQPYCRQCVCNAKQASRKLKDGETYTCPHCPKSYPLRDSLVRHVREKHPIT